MDTNYNLGMLDGLLMLSIGLACGMIIALALFTASGLSKDRITNKQLRDYHQPDAEHVTINQRVASKFHRVNEEVNEVKSDVKEIEDDITSMRVDIITMQGNIRIMQGDITGMQSGIKGIQGDIAGVKDDIKDMDAKFTEKFDLIIEQLNRK